MPANETEPSLLQYCYDTSSNVKDSFQCLETLGTRHFRMNTWFPWIFDGGEDGDWVGLRDRPWRLLGIIMFPTNPNAAKHCIAKWGWKTRYDLSYLLICATLHWKWTIVSCPTVPALFSNEKRTEAGNMPVVGMRMLKSCPSESVNLALTFPVETNRFKRL